jgi:hypothetical protein
MCRILVKEKNDAEIELNYFDLCVFFFIFTSTHQINYDIFYERLQTWYHVVILVHTDAYAFDKLSYSHKPVSVYIKLKS